MEAEARRILQNALDAPNQSLPENLYERIHRRFAALGGTDELDLPSREPAREPPRFD
jgi:plasmid stability protein